MMSSLLKRSTSLTGSPLRRTPEIEYLGTANGQIVNANFYATKDKVDLLQLKYRLDMIMLKLLLL